MHSLSRQPAMPLVAPPGDSGPHWTIQLKTHGPQNSSMDAPIQKPQHFPGPPGLRQTSDLQKRNEMTQVKKEVPASLRI